MDPITFMRKRTAGSTDPVPDLTQSSATFAFNPYDDSSFVNYRFSNIFFSDSSQNTTERYQAYTTDLVNQVDKTQTTGEIYGSQADVAGVQYQADFFAANPSETPLKPFSQKIGLAEFGYRGTFAASADQTKMIYVQTDGVVGQLKVASSNDGGATWTETQTAITVYTAGRHPQVYWHKNRFIVKIYMQPRIWQSTDGITWSWSNDTALFNGKYVIYSDFFCTESVCGIMGGNANGDLEIIWSNDIFETHAQTYSTATIPMSAQGAYFYRVAKKTDYSVSDKVVLTSGSLGQTATLTFNGSTWVPAVGSTAPTLIGRNTNGTITLIYSVIHDPIAGKFYAGATETGFSGGGGQFPISTLMSSTDGLSWVEVGDSSNANISSGSIAGMIPMFCNSSGDVFASATRNNNFIPGIFDTVAFMGGVRYNAGYSDKDYGIYDTRSARLNTDYVIDLAAETDMCIASEYNAATGVWNIFKAKKSISSADVTPYRYFVSSNTSSFTVKESEDSVTWTDKTYNISPAFTSTINNTTPVVSCARYGDTMLGMFSGPNDNQYNVFIGEVDPSGNTSLTAIDCLGSGASKLGVIDLTATFDSDYAVSLFSPATNDNNSSIASMVGYEFNLSQQENQNVTRLILTTNRFKTVNSFRVPSDDLNFFGGSTTPYDPSAVGVNRAPARTSRNDNTTSLLIRQPFYGALFGGESSAGDSGFLMPINVIENDGTNIIISTEVRLCKFGPDSSLDIGTTDIISSFNLPKNTIVGSTITSVYDPQLNQNRNYVYIQSNQKGRYSPATKIVFSVNVTSTGNTQNYVYDVATDTFTLLTGTVPGTSETYENLTLRAYSASEDKFVFLLASNRSVYVLLDPGFTSGVVVDNPLGYA